MNMIRSKPAEFRARSLVSDDAARAWDEAYDAKVRQHSRPVEIEVPVVSVALFAVVAIPLFVAVMLLWPNPA